MEKVIQGDYGSIKVDAEGNVISFERGATLQGFVYKNMSEFKPGGGVCYIPELSDTMYTYDNLIEICGDYDTALTVLDMVDWQHVESLHDEIEQDNEMEENM